MRFVAATLFCLATASLGAAIDGAAQERPAAGASTADPRASLKAGFRDAGVAAWNMTLVSNSPKPDGFFLGEAGRPAI